VGKKKVLSQTQTKQWGGRRRIRRKEGERGVLNIGSAVGERITDAQVTAESGLVRAPGETVDDGAGGSSKPL